MAKVWRLANPEAKRQESEEANAKLGIAHSRTMCVCAECRMFFIVYYAISPFRNAVLRSLETIIPLVKASAREEPEDSLSAIATENGRVSR